MLLIVAVVVGDLRFAEAALVLSALAALAVGFLAVFRRIKGVEPNHFWYSTGFAAAILSSMVLASWWLWDSPGARILIALAGAAAFLAGTTSFCLGRIVYVVIFQETLQFLQERQDRGLRMIQKPFGIEGLKSEIVEVTARAR